MFAIGRDEPIDGFPALVRHSIVWLGESSGQSSLGIPKTHPYSQAIVSILSNFAFRATWLLCSDVRDIAPLKRQAMLLKLSKAGWSVSDSDEWIKAHRFVTTSEPWPYSGAMALPDRPHEILVVGAHVGSEELQCGRADLPPGLEGDAANLPAPLVEVLLERNAYAVCFGRTHTENSPGMWLIGPPGINPESFVPQEQILRTFTAAAAGRAWSFPRVTQGLASD